MISPHRVTCALVLLAGLSGRLNAQGTAANVPTRDRVLTAAREIMVTARYCTMITNGPGLQPQARIVDAFSPDTNLIVWIATNALTRKVEEIKRDPHVTLLYWNAATFEFVTLQGTAVLSNEAKDKAVHWKPEWARLYKDENRGSDFLLVKVTPSRVEVVSAKRGLSNDPVTWRPTSVTFP